MHNWMSNAARRCNVSLKTLTCFNAAGIDLKDKPVAVFGLGDAVGYSEYFCDAMEEIYSTFKSAGAKMIGHWPADGYEHEGSKVTS